MIDHFSYRELVKIYINCHYKIDERLKEAVAESGLKLSPALLDRI